MADLSRLVSQTPVSIVDLLYILRRKYDTLYELFVAGCYLLI